MPDFSWLVKNPYNIAVALGFMIAFYSFSWLSSIEGAYQDRIIRFQDGITSNVLVKEYMDKKFEALREDVAKTSTVYDAGQTLRKFQSQFNEDFVKAFNIAEVQKELDRAIQPISTWKPTVGAAFGVMLAMFGLFNLIMEHRAAPPMGGRTG
ncbi:hypothetical protein [Agrobacterium rosae]|uniref:hypothetical protein n=1 Tax=Agrobacterium rosae TaxID=1972867 RepID=UPI000CD98BD7|nr:hypothetical protein [Agrobacterium rosae]POO56263.1 hypothetical protein CTT39_05880 [Agrobacterium rosae]